MPTTNDLPKDPKELDDYLCKCADELTGKLGLMSKTDYEYLKEHSPADWDFAYHPCGIDESVGKVKMVPKSRKAIDILDLSRAKKLSTRHKWLSLPRARHVIRAIKHKDFGMVPEIQDFALHYWRYGEMVYLMRDRDAFDQWVKTRSERFTYTKERLDALFDLIPIVAKVLSHRHIEKPNNQ